MTSNRKSKLAGRVAGSRTLYFAYGSNLNKEQMEWRCPKARPLFKMILPDYQLVFRNVADIVHMPGAECHGALWEITPECEAALDRYEGYPRLYVKHTFQVSVVHNGKRKVRDVMTYTMHERNADRFALPADFYLDTIAEGYKDFGIGPDSLVMALKTTEDLRNDERRSLA